MKNNFKYLVIGLGVQGKKRVKIDRKNLVGTVDILNKKADYEKIEDVPLNLYNSAYVCVPDKEKIKIIKYLIKNKKNILVEKPLISSEKQLKQIFSSAKKNRCILYVAYNHRFEPFLLKIKKFLEEKKIGNIYFCNMSYGNGTSMLIKKSNWKDKNKGVLSDIGSHLLDLTYWLFNFKENISFKKLTSGKFENNSNDYSLISCNYKNTKINLEMTYCMWRNSFKLDIIGSSGSIHMDCLCKWGPSKLIFRERVRPSGIPKSKIYKIEMKDPTWKKEHQYFKKLVKKLSFSNQIRKNIWINNNINKI